MSHHGHSMQRGLSIEQNEITVLEAALNNDTGVDLLPDFLLGIREIKIKSLESLISRLGVGSGADDKLYLVRLGQLDDLLDVVLSNLLGDGQLL